MTRTMIGVTRITVRHVRAAVLGWLVIAPWSWAGSAHAQDEPGRAGDSALGAGAGGSAWSEGVSASDRGDAEALFQGGNRFMDDIAFADADAMYAAALEKWNHPVIHFNRAIAQINLLQSIEAYRSLEEALRYGRAPYEEEQYDRALKTRKQLEETLTRVKISCAQTDVQASLDGQPLALGPDGRCRDERMVRPGGHQLIATRVDYETYREQVVGDPGEEVTVVVRLEPREGTLLERRHPFWMPWAVVGSGAPMLIVGAVFHSFAASEFAAFDENFVAPGICAIDGCGPDETGIRNIFDVYDRGVRWRRVALALYGAGFVAATAGLVWAFYNQPRPVKRKRPRTGDLRLLPAVDGERAGLLLDVRF